MRPATPKSPAVACPPVDFVERGVTSGRQCSVWRRLPEPLQRAEVDTLVLGRTHHPLLSGLIQLAMGENGHAGLPAPRRPL